MNVRALFSRKSILFEASGFGNIIFLTTEDRHFIKNVGVYVFDNFDPKHEINVREAADMSPLYKMLKKESQLQLSGEKRVFWSEKSYDPNNFKEGFNVGSVSEKMIKSEGYLLSKSLRKENVFLYLPVVEDWLNYYIPKSINETVESREILKCSHVALKGQHKKRNVITINNKMDLVDVIREGKQ